MSDTTIDPSIPYRLPRHLAQTLIGRILQHGAPACGLLYHSSDSPAIAAGNCCNDAPALMDDIRRHIACGHRPVGIYLFGRPNDLSLTTSAARAHTCCHDITLLLELSADTKGRVELEGFVYRDGRLQPLNVQLEEDGILYPDCVNR